MFEIHVKRFAWISGLWDVVDEDGHKYYRHVTVSELKSPAYLVLWNKTDYLCINLTFWEMT